MGLDLSIFIEGAGKARDLAIAAATRAIDVFAEQVVGDAQQLCPIDTGALAGSGTAGRDAKSVAGDIEIKVEDHIITKEVGFNTDYAVYVHENLEANHPKGGQAKFLETSIRENTPKFGPFIASAVKEALS